MIDKKKVLGRGLDALLPAARATAVAAVPAPAGEHVQQIPLENIEQNPYQTREHVDEAAMNELAASIKETGVVQPIVVRQVPSTGKYQIIAGERRWAASQRAGKHAIPAIVRQVSNQQAMEMTIIENLQREDLNALEQAKAFERLAREFSLTQEQIAQKTGKDRTSISNYLRLLKLPPDIQLGLANGKLTMGHAKALMMLDLPEQMFKAVLRIEREALSVRQTEELVHALSHPSERPAPKMRVVDPNVREAELELERALGVRVKIQDAKGKGKIIIEYSSLDDFDRVLEALGRR